MYLLCDSSLFSSKHFVETDQQPDEVLTVCFIIDAKLRSINSVHISQHCRSLISMYSTVECKLKFQMRNNRHKAA
jgi:hypothetical protein